MRNHKFLIFVLLPSLVLVGCQKLAPQLPEEKEATMAQILMSPQEYKELELKTTGILRTSQGGLILEDQGLKIAISTESSKIKAEDFVGRKVEVGGTLTTKGGEQVLEIEWIGVVGEEAEGETEASRMAEEKKESLAAVLGVEKEKIEVVSAEEVEWSSMDLGVPEPGMMYAQVITPGFKIIYRVGGKTSEVHTNFEGTIAVLVEQRTKL